MLWSRAGILLKRAHERVEWWFACSDEPRPQKCSLWQQNSSMSICSFATSARARSESLIICTCVLRLVWVHCQHKWVEKASVTWQQNRGWCNDQPHYHETVTALYNSVQLTP
jgi:hypothetical protein